MEFTPAEGSQATHRKIAVGKIINYFKKNHIAQAQILSAPLETNDNIQIQGPTTGVIELKVTQLRTAGKRLANRIEKGPTTFPCPQLVRRNDVLYKIVEIDHKDNNNA